MKVSIITATYNSLTNIKSCLDSVINQDYSDIELIIIDGSSTDNTVSVVKKYQQNHPFIKLISEKDKGIYDALNKGVNLACGDIIGFVHSDDFLDSNNIISDIVLKFEKGNMDGVFGDLQYIDKRKKNIRKWKSCEFTPKLLRKGWMPAHPTFFLKKGVYKNHGLFDLSYKISADYDFMLRVLKDKTLKFSYLPRVITNMRIGGASNKNLKNIAIKMIEDYRAIRKNKTGGIYTLILKNTSKIKQFF